MNESEETIQKPIESKRSEKPREIPNLQRQIDKTFHAAKMQLAVLGFTGLVLLLPGFFWIFQQVTWNKNVRTWDKAEGILLKNTTKRVSRGKRSVTVSDVEYQFTYHGRQYSGTRIVYDSDDFPPLKIGTHCTIIVNPKNPIDCAILIPSGKSDGFSRWLSGMDFYFLAILLIPGLIYLIKVANKRIIVPDELKNYIASFSPEQFFSARDRERLPDPLDTPELTRPMEYQQENRYGIMQKHGYKSVYAACAVLPLGFAVGAIFSRDYYPVLLLIAALTVVLMAGIIWLYYHLNTGEMTVFDFQEKKIFHGRCRRFSPENIKEMEVVSFSKIDHLSLSLFEIEQGTKSGSMMVKHIGLLAVKSDGDGIPLCKASKTNLPRLFALLPDLAEKMGHLLITHF